MGRYTSLALDSSGNPHISYYDSTNKNVKYAYQDDTGWHLGIVGPASSQAPYPSLALDSDGTAHVSYFDWANSDLEYAYAKFVSFRVYLPIIARQPAVQPDCTW
ncbi:MAG: hypothetical protein JXM73_23945 [Anaerolineae bacterium]|nr:hypothetical protein [Anaerolineae bacterium]